MDPIRPIVPLPAGSALDPPPADRPASADDTQGSKPLDPAVSIALSPDAQAATEHRGFERDAETQALVFRITEAANGDVVLQIPDEIVLRARTYAREPNPPAGERVAKSA